jgi:hypothetical protein
MDAGFVRELAAAFRRPDVVGLSLMVPEGWRRAEPPVATALELGTLTGLLDYVRANVDGLDLGRALVHVVSPESVVLCSFLEGETTAFRRQVFCHVTTALVGPPPLPFGRYVEAETFVVALQAGFVPTPDRENMLELIASIRESSVRDTLDTGVAQEVKTAKGVALLGRTAVPARVILQPWRTFREVEQPSSEFVLRLQGNPEGPKPHCALFEAQGGQWKLEAVQRIAAYLRERLQPAVPVVA